LKKIFQEWETIKDIIKSYERKNIFYLKESEMILKEINKKDISNIFIFVCDSLRWDYAPKAILNKGIAIKTIASSLYTAPSFPCIISGLYPNKTGVHNWENILKNKLRGMFNFQGYHKSLWCETTWIDLPPWDSDLHRVLGKPPGISLEKISEPFVYIEDDKGGHCPYGIPFGNYNTFDEYYLEIGKLGNAELRTQYQKGVEQSVNRFEKRIQLLQERNLLDQTLVIFTSDHGELLGEYGGFVDHGRPPCPELIYVPTVFIHPSLTPKIIQDEIISHIDVFPTISSILDKKLHYEPDGIDLTKEELPKMGLNYRIGGYFDSRDFFDTLTNYRAVSVWDEKGGHIFHSLNRYVALALFSYLIFFKHHPEFTYFNENLKHNSKAQLKDLKSIIQHLIKPYQQYGIPKIDKKQAKQLIDRQQRESLRFSEKMKIDNVIFNLMKKTSVSK